jgi:hypothetical protein
MRDPCSIIASKTSRRYSRRTSLAEKPWLPTAFGAFPLCYSFPLLLEPAVNEGEHQDAGRDAAPVAVAAQAQVGLLLEPHGHRLVAQWAHRRPLAYTSPPLLAPPRQAAYFLDLGGATYLEAIYPSARPVIGRSSRSSSLLEAPFRDGDRYRNPSGTYNILCLQRRLRPSNRCYSLSYTGAIVCQDGEGLRAILLRGG